MSIRRNALAAVLPFFALLAVNPAPILLGQQGPSLDGMTLHVVPQSHIDLAWWWRYDPETIKVIVPKTLAMAFVNFDKYPDYTFSFLQVPAIEPLEKDYPEYYYKIHYYLYHSEPMGLTIPNPHGEDPSQGRFKIVHGFYVESDACVPGGEAVVRQCLYGKRFYKHKFGIDVKTAWFADAWTHPWTYPQILKKSGIDSYMFQRGFAGDHHDQMFWWEGPDGSRLFAYRPGFSNGVPDKEKWTAALKDVSRRYGVKDYMGLIGVGDHGGGVPEGDIEVTKKIMSEMQPVKAQFSTPDKFLKGVLNQNVQFPTVKYEISPTIRGAYTTRGEIKKRNRESEDQLMTVEKFASTAMSLGDFHYPHAELDAAWKKVLLNQFHDTISGTTLPDANDDAMRSYQQVLDSTKVQLNRTLNYISSKINTQGQGIPVVVYNPLSWERTDTVEAELHLDPSVKGVDVTDADGSRVPTQIVSEIRDPRSYDVKVLFLADGVPSLGYKTYRVIPKSEATTVSSPLEVSTTDLENEFFKVEIDPSTGCVTRVFDKRQNREVLDKSGRGNLIQVLDDFGDSEGFLRDADGKVDSEYKWTDKTEDVVAAPAIKVVENGPVRAVVQIKKKWGLARFTQTVILYQRIPRVDFGLTMDWKGHQKMVKVAFPLNVHTAEATYEIPYGTIRRPNKGEEENAQKWVDLSDANYGISLLNDSRYGYDVKGDTIRLSVLRSPTGPIFATDEIGTHTLRYSLFPHTGSWQDSEVTQRGDEFNYPLTAVVDTPHEGQMPTMFSFLHVTPNNVIVEAVKRAEDSDNLIVRMYETTGKKCVAKLTLANPVDAVHQTDLLENDLKDVPTDGTSFEAPLGPSSIETFKLIKDK